MANLVIKSTTFAPFTGGFTGVIPANNNYYSEGGPFGPPPWLGEVVKEEEDITFDSVDGTGGRDRGFRHRPLSASLIFCGTVASAEAAAKAFFESLRPTSSPVTRFTITTPGGSAIQGCKLRTTSSQNWQNLSGKCLYLVSCTFHQLSLTN